MLFTVKASPATLSLVKITLALISGIPAGDQFPLEDQRPSPAAPLQKAGAPKMGLAMVTRAAKSARLRAWDAFFI
jgi:hypothetical protein